MATSHDDTYFNRQVLSLQKKVLDAKILKIIYFPRFFGPKMLKKCITLVTGRQIGSVLKRRNATDYGCSLKTVNHSFLQMILQYSLLVAEQWITISTSLLTHHSLLRAVHQPLFVRCLYFQSSLPTNISTNSFWSLLIRAVKRFKLSSIENMPFLETPS